MKSSFYVDFSLVDSFRVLMPARAFHDICSSFNNIGITSTKPLWYRPYLNSILSWSNQLLQIENMLLNWSLNSLKYTNLSGPLSFEHVIFCLFSSSHFIALMILYISMTAKLLLITIQKYWHRKTDILACTELVLWSWWLEQKYYLLRLTTE